MNNANHSLRSYLNDQEVANMLGISLKSLRNKINLQHPLPTYICPPSSRTRLWPEDDLHAWLSEFRTEASHLGQVKINRIKRCK